MLILKKKPVIAGFEPTQETSTDTLREFLIIFYSNLSP